VATLGRPDWTPRRGAFSGDGRYFAASGDGGVTRIWEVETQREVARLRTDGDPAIDVVFSPDDRYLATAHVDDRTVRLWLWRPEDLIDAACRRLTRNLSEEEWRQYVGAEPYRKTCENLP
jgi:WD40 repeat protein